jgi:hypothetical protein
MSVWIWAVRVGDDYSTEGDSENEAGLGVAVSTFAVESPFVLCTMYSGGTRLRHCTKNRQVVGSIPDGAIFIDIIPPAALMALVSTQPLTGYQEYFMGVKTAGV